MRGSILFYTILNKDDHVNFDYIPSLTTLRHRHGDRGDEEDIRGGGERSNRKRAETADPGGNSGA